MNGWWFAQPAALWILFVVPPLWWLARRSERGEPQWTAALAIWRRAVQSADPEAARAQNGIPLSLIAALLAFVFGVLSLADPQRASAPVAPARWTLVLDRSASMFLGASDAPNSPTRVERAVELAVGLCERAQVAPEAREWSTFAFDGMHAARGERPPREWFLPEWGPGAPTPWSQLDTPEHVWVSDCGPDFVALRAGRVLCGATPIPGAIADLGSRCLHWDGGQLVELDWPGVRPGVAFGAELPAELALFARIWADERRLTIQSDPSAVCLRVERSIAAPGAREQGGRLLGQNWSIDARASIPAATAQHSTWAEFEDREGRRFPAVLWRPGEIRIAVSSLAAAQVDPAVFALAWSALFDSARLADPGVVSLAERTKSASEAIHEPGADAPTETGAVRSLATPMAALASAFALAALGLKRRRRALQGDPGAQPGRPARAPAGAGLG